MNRYSRLMGILILSLLALNVAGTAAQGPAPQAAPITSTFNYQGRIIKDGVPITSTCAIEFKLFDASTGGNQIGTSAQLRRQRLHRRPALPPGRV